LGSGFLSHCSGRTPDRGATRFRRPGRNEADAVSTAYRK